MRLHRETPAMILLALLAAPAGLAVDHRAAPGSVFDPKADITDLYAFRSYEPGRTNFVTIIMWVDGFSSRETARTGFPFHPDILYEIKIDNNNDANADIIFS